MSNRSFPSLYLFIVVRRSRAKCFSVIFYLHQLRCPKHRLFVHSFSFSWSASSAGSWLFPGLVEGQHRIAQIDHNFSALLGEWFLRLLCKLIALGAAIVGAGGLAIIGFQAVLPLLDRGVYVGAACASIACVAVMFGLVPMAVEVDNALLRLLGGKELLARHDEQ